MNGFWTYEWFFELVIPMNSFESIKDEVLLKPASRGEVRPEGRCLQGPFFMWRWVDGSVGVLSLNAIPPRWFCRSTPLPTGHVIVLSLK
jgi:hypothetical protein